MYSEESFPDGPSLLQQLKLGNKEAFNELFLRFADPVMTYIVFRLQDEKDAEDVLQEVFIKLWHKRQQIEIHTSFKNYLYTIVQHCISDHFRLRKKNKYLPVAELPDIQEDHCQPNDHYQYKQLHQLWKQAIKRLPVQMGRIYAMKNEEALSVKEIATELDLSEQTVKNQLHTASQRIVKILQQVHLFFL
jgi:RNA polymerase sigma-70 factor (ECF subfamily)